MARRELEIIKEKLDIVDFLRSYIQLSPAGRNLKALCPFHQEKTPSFIVSPDKKIWHCFGCGEGGDIVTFLMKYEHLEFPEALRVLAERAGVPMKSLSPTQEREFGILYDIHESASEFFVDELKKNEKIQKYLEKRGIKKDTIEEFGVGFSPLGDKLTLYLLKKKFELKDIMRAGLTQKWKGLNRDRFEGRIIFPIHNSFGKVVAFTGRIFQVREGGEIDEAAKYLNSSDTPIFNKSKILYGLHKSKKGISESRSAFIVEGQTDLLMAWQSGIKNVIAVSGTALTRDHLERLKRFADTIYISFDNDDAGLHALERGIDIFHEFDFHVKAINLGKFKDPAEAVEKDPEFLKTAITQAKPALEYVFEKYFPEGSNTELDISKRKRIIAHLLGKIKRMKSAVEEGIWIKNLSKISDIGEGALLEEFDKIQIKNRPITDETEIETKTEPTRQEVLARRLVLLGFTAPEFFSIVKQNKKLFPENYQNIIDAPKDEKYEIFRMRSVYEFQGEDKSSLEKELHKLLGYLKLEYLEKKRRALHKDLKNAETGEKEKELEKIMKDFNSLSKEIHELKEKNS